MSKTKWVGMLLAASVSSSALAQFSPFVTLPSGDFTWRWGDLERTTRRFEDIDVNGGEATFRCELKAALSPSSRRTQNEIRQLENELTTSLYFIQAATETMNILDQQLELDWAELSCVESEAAEPDPEKSQERVDRAREKAVREMLERRERRERREGR